MDDDKRKITVYLSEGTYQNLNQYIACNYVSAYGATSNTVGEALDHYLWSVDSLKSPAIERSRMWETFQEKLKEVKNENV